MSARLIFCVKKNQVRVFFDSFNRFSVRFVAERYILQQKCLKGHRNLACYC